MRIHVLGLVFLGAVLVHCSPSTSALNVLDEQSTSSPSSCPGSTELGKTLFLAAKAGHSTVRPLAISRRNTVARQAIVGGEAFASAAAELIASATKQVLITSFIIDDGWIAGKLRAAIQALPSRVEVYILTNTDRSFWVEGDPLTTIHRVEAILNPSHRPRVTIGAWTAPNPEGSLIRPGMGLLINHDKSIIVDRERALIGNINMELPADPLSANPQGDWYQYALRVDGDIAAQLASEVTGAWQHHTFTGEAAPPLNWALRPMRDPLPGACTPILPLGRAAGEGDDSSANRAFVAFFTSARRALRVITPDLNAPTARQALARATRNAELYLILSKGFLDNLEALQGGTNEKNIQILIEETRQSGDLCKLHIRWYASAEHPGEPVEGEGRGASHAKFASADQQLMILGSQNMDLQSWTRSQELNIAVDDPKTTSVFDAEFNRAWERSAPAYEKVCSP